MELEYQQTIILLSVIVILTILYFSSLYDRDGSKENNYILFSMLIFTCFIALYQVRKLRDWRKEKKTDYILVYNSYLVFTILIFIYSFYIIATRSKLECFRIISASLDSISIKMVNSIKQEGGVRDSFRYTFDIYKNVWKKMLFL